MMQWKKTPSYSDLAGSANSHVLSPFFLHVTVHRAANLPIKDYTSSDPYVELFIGSNQVEKGGRSPTIFRQLNPNWEWKADPIPLLHLHSPLRVKIFDEDQGERSDFMGQISVFLGDLENNLDNYVTMTRPLRDALDTRDEPSTVTLSVMLKRSDNIVKLRRQVDSLEVPTESASTHIREYLWQLFEFFGTPLGLRQALLKSNLVRKSNADEYQLYDLVSDVYCLIQQIGAESKRSLAKLLRTSGSDEDLHIIDILGKVRKSHQLIRSTTIDLHTGECTRGQPNTDNAIQLIFRSHDHQDCDGGTLHNCKLLLVLPTVHITWTWVKWLRFLMAMWEGRSGSMMEWAIDQGLTLSTVGNSASLFVGGVCYRGVLKLDFSRPFTLGCFDVSTSSELYSVDLRELFAINVSVDAVPPGKHVLRISHLKLYNHNLLERFPLVHSDVAPTLSEKTKEKFKDKPKEKYRVTIKSVQSWSTHHFAETVSSAEGDLLDLNWHQPVDIDILQHELDPKNTCGLDLLVYRVGLDKDDLVTSQFVPYNSIVRAVHSNVRVGSAPMQVFRTNLKCQQAWKITLVRAIQLPLHGGLIHKTAQIKAKCRFARIDRKICRDEFEPITKFSKTYSSPFPASKDPNFGNSELILRAEDGFEESECIALQLTAIELGISYPIGVCFIPLSSFTRVESSEMEFKLSRQGLLEPDLPHFEQILHRERIEAGNFGSIIVRVQKLSDTTGQPLKAQFSCSYGYDFTSRWPAEGILTNSVGGSFESFTINPSALGLLFWNPTGWSAAEDGLFHGLKQTAVPKIATAPSKPEDIFKTCQECGKDSEPGIIPWASVKGINPVSQSVLCVTASINRRFSEAGAVVFRPVSVDIFVLNCPVEWLSKLMMDQKALNEVRAKLVDAYSRQRVMNEAHVEPSIEDEQGSDSTVTAIAFPPACEAVNELEHIIVSTDNDIANIEDQQSFEEEYQLVHGVAESASNFSGDQGQLVDARKLTELDRLLVKQCRTWLYFYAALEIPNKRKLTEEEFLVRRDLDFQSVQKIVSEVANKDGGAPSGTDVESSMYRLEFLLDQTELHIREAQLAFRGNEENFVSFVELVLNSYLVKIVSLLGLFFEANTAIRFVKGLKCKTELLATCFANNERLHSLVERVLSKPFGIFADPKPKLSLFLKIKHLAGWYNNALEDDMSGAVRNCLEAAKLESQREQPQQGVPWLYEKICSKWCTNMPEVVKTTLLQYLEYARIKLPESTTQELDTALVDELDMNVEVSYVNAYGVLAMAYSEELSGPCWYDLSPFSSRVEGDSRNSVSSSTLNQAPNEEDLLLSKIEWLCSVMNDAQRLCSPAMLRIPSTESDSGRPSTPTSEASGSQRLPGKPIGKNRVSNAIRETRGLFAHVVQKAADVLSAIMYRYIACIDNYLLLAPSLLALPTTASRGDTAVEFSNARVAPPPNAPLVRRADSISAEKSWMNLHGHLKEFFVFVLGAEAKAGLGASLESRCLNSLLVSFANRTVGWYLLQLNMLRRHNYQLEGQLVDDLERDIANVRCVIVNAVGEDLSTGTQCDSVFSVLHAVCGILGYSDFSSAQRAIAEFVSKTTANPADALLWRDLLDWSIEFRPDSHRAQRRSSFTLTGLFHHSTEQTKVPNPKITQLVIQTHDEMKAIGNAHKATGRQTISAVKLLSVVFSMEASEKSIGKFLFTPMENQLGMSKHDGRRVLEWGQVHRRILPRWSITSTFTGHDHISSPAKLARDDSAGTPDILHIEVRNISISHLPALSVMRNAVYLSLDVRGTVQTTTTLNSLNPSWTTQSYQFEVEDSAALELFISVYFKGMLGLRAVKVASALVPLRNLNIADIENEEFPLDFRDSAKAQKLVEGEIATGHDRPVLKLTIRKQDMNPVTSTSTFSPLPISK